MSKNKFEVIIKVKTEWSKEQLRKELTQLFSKNSIVKAETITIK